MRILTLVAILLIPFPAVAQDIAEKSPVPGITDAAWGKVLESLDNKKRDCDSMELMGRILMLKLGRPVSEEQVKETLACANQPDTNGWKDADGLKWQMAVYFFLELQDQKELEELRAFKARIERAIQSQPAN